MLYQNIRMALIAIFHSKLRSFLTILGVVIGISSVVSVVAVGTGFRQQLDKEVKKLGIDVININANEDGQPLSEADVKTVQSINGVTATTPIVYINAIPTLGDKELKTSFVSGVYIEIGKIITQPLSGGQYFTAGQKKVAVIGGGVAQSFFGKNDPIGKEIMLKYKTINSTTGAEQSHETSFKVVGTIKKQTEKSTFGLGSQYDNAVYIPYEDSKEISSDAVIATIAVKVGNSNSLKEVSQSITSKLKHNHQDKEDFTLITAEDVAKSFNQTLSTTTNFVTAVAAISLLVGGIGIMNIMLSSVAERTREIGIRKAIGAKKSILLMQFLMEALTLTILGGLLGIVVAFQLAKIASQQVKVQPVFTLKAYVLAIGISVLIGIVFGLAPAIQAARKKPVDSLRYE